MADLRANFRSVRSSFSKFLNPGASVVPIKRRCARPFFSLAPSFGGDTKVGPAESALVRFPSHRRSCGQVPGNRQTGERRAKLACCRGASPCRKGRSESILTSSLAGGTVKCCPKRRQGHWWTGQLRFEKPEDQDGRSCGYRSGIIQPTSSDCESRDECVCRYANSVPTKSTKSLARHGQNDCRPSSHCRSDFPDKPAGFRTRSAHKTQSKGESAQHSGSNVIDRANQCH